LFGDVFGKKSLVLGEPEKRPQRRDFQVKTFGAQPTGRTARFARRRPRLLLLQKRLEVAQLDLRPIRESVALGPGNEFAQQRRVGARRVLRLPALVAQVLQEIFDQRLHQLRRRPPGGAPRRRAGYRCAHAQARQGAAVGSPAPMERISARELNGFPTHKKPGHRMGSRAFN